jgi:hypothetical protein
LGLTTAGIAGTASVLLDRTPAVLAAYAKNTSGASIEGWMDSGGRSGGGVPASAVRTLMRQGLGAGLTNEQVRAFLQPGFLRGISDPWGGARLLDFIGHLSRRANGTAEWRTRRRAGRRTDGASDRRSRSCASDLGTDH